MYAGQLKPTTCTYATVNVMMMTLLVCHNVTDCMYAIVHIMVCWYVLQCCYIPDHEHDSCDTMVQLLVVCCAVQHHADIVQHYLPE